MAYRPFSASFRKLAGIWKRVLTAEIIVAVLALLLTVFSAAATHKHERLSVIPKLSFDWNTGSNDVIGLFVENSGAGPAVIRTFTITGDEMALFAWYRLFTKPPVVTTYFPTYFFQAGARSALITAKRENVKDIDAFKRLIGGGVLLTIEYCSVYGDCWTECSKIADPTCGLNKSPARDIFNAGFWSKIL